MKQYNYLIIFFIPEMGLLDSEIQKNIRLLVAASRPGSVKIIFLKENITVKDISEKRKELKYKVDVHTLVYSKKRDKMILRRILVNKVQTDTKDSIHLLLSYFLKVVSADHRLLYILSHGAAFGILNDPPNQVVPLLNNKVRITHPEHVIIRHIPPGIILDGIRGFINIDGVSLGDNNELIFERKKIGSMCKDLGLFWVSDLEKTIVQEGKGQKVDLIVMNNCYMQLIDNVYILRNATSYLVASETGMAEFDFDVIKMVEAARKEKLITPGEMAERIIDDFGVKTDSHSKEFTAVFAAKTEDAELLVAKFNSVVEILIRKLNTVKPFIDEILNKEMLQFDNIVDPPFFSSLVDVRWVFLHIANKTRDRDILHAVNSFIEVMDTKVIVSEKMKFIGNQILIEDAVPGARKLQPTGFSISFPPSKETFESASVLQCAFWGREANSPFAAGSLWDEFLKLLF